METRLPEISKLSKNAFFMTHLLEALKCEEF
jgi:hypothetical protein